MCCSQRVCCVRAPGVLPLCPQRILKVDYHIPSHIKLSPEGHDLLKRVLVADPATRINIQQVCKAAAGPSRHMGAGCVWCLCIGARSGKGLLSSSPYMLSWAGVWPGWQSVGRCPLSLSEATLECQLQHVWVPFFANHHPCTVLWFPGRSTTTPGTTRTCLPV